MSRDRVEHLERRLRRECAGRVSIGEQRLAAVRAHVEATEAGAEPVFPPRAPRVIVSGVIAAMVVGAGVWGLSLTRPGAPDPGAEIVARGAPALLSPQRWAPVPAAPTELALTAEARRVTEDMRRVGDAVRSRIAALERVSPRLTTGGHGG